MQSITSKGDLRDEDPSEKTIFSCERQVLKIVVHEIPPSFCQSEKLHFQIIA